MKATSLSSGGGMGRRLPTGRVVTNVVRQEVDLRPPGNTIVVETLSDNPFEEAAPVQIVAQESGGGYAVPEHMQSHHLQHSYLPGLGEEAPEPETDTSPGFLDFLTTAATKTGEVLTAREQRKLAEAGVVTTPTGTVRTPTGTMPLPQKSGMSTTMLVVGGLALVGVGAFFLMGKKGRRKRR